MSGIRKKTIFCSFFAVLFLVCLFQGILSAQNYNFAAKWGSNLTSDGSFHGPWGVAVDSSGNVYVADSGNNRIQKFSPTRDILWRNASDGRNIVWYMNGVTRIGAAYLTTVADQNWKMIGGQNNY